MTRVFLSAAMLLFSYSVMSQFGGVFGSKDHYAEVLRGAIETFNENPNFQNKKKVTKMIDLAVELGWDIASIIGESESYSGAVNGIVIGVRSNLTRPDKKLVIDGGINYVGSGGKYEEYHYEPGGGGSSGDSKLRLNYLNFPITAKYRKHINNGFYGEAGIQPGFLLGAKDKSSEGTSDVKEGFNKFDVGLILGGGYQIGRKLGVGVRVVPGLININTGEYNEQKDKNLNVSLRASYRLF